MSPRTPPSSPSSSSGPVDSSPPSSPSPVVLDSPPAFKGLSHPFAASSRSDRRPPLYEKKINTPLAISLPQFISKAPATRAFAHAYEQDNYVHGGSLSHVANFEPLDPEARLWDQSITNAVDNGQGRIDLSNQNLTYIPQSIGDLRHFCVLPVQRELTSRGRLFSKSNVMPVNPSSLERSFERTSSITDSSIINGQEQDKIQLYLSANAINRLPRELFTVTRISVLSLRNNNLTYIPPQIASLTQLRVLNLSYNKFTYLPSEMLGMSLDSLNLFPNNFLSEPASNNAELSQRVGTLAGHGSLTRVWSQRAAKDQQCSAVSETTLLDLSCHVPSLSELCLRVLLTPCRTSGHPNPSSKLAELYPLPIPGEWGDRPISISLQDTLNACIPGSVSAMKTISPNSTPRTYKPAKSDTNTADEFVMGINVCPCPSHRTRQVFVRHVEERFTWENKVGGILVGGMVPLLWRGCLSGCLAFLDGRDKDPSNLQHPQPVVEDHDADNGMDVDEEDGSAFVQAIDLGPAGLGEEDFEDDG